MIVINTHYYACCASQPAGDWFYFEDATGAANTLSLVKSNTNAPSVTLQYSYDGNTWTTWGTTSTTALTLNIPANSKVYLRGTNTAFGNASYYNKFSSTGNVNCGGVISSMLTNSEEPLLDLTGHDYMFKGMFYGMTTLLNAPELPATTLANYCYQSMFYNCSSLTSSPELPATTLVDSCYNSMFNGCSSLTTVQTLPATTLAIRCYSEMFSGCTSLTSAPELSATTLANYCYYNMFRGCTSLTSAPSLSVTTLANNCYQGMFGNCSSLTIAPSLPATTLANYCYREMFSYCTSLTSSPELPATTLVSNCYYRMFEGCSNLNEIHCNAIEISATNCTNGWVYSVSSTGTFYRNANNESWTIGESGIPNGWTIVPPFNEYFYFEDATGAANTLSLVKSNTSAPDVTLEYSYDGNTWTTWGTTSTTAKTLSIPANSKVYLRGTNTAFGNASYYNKFSSTGNVSCGGVISSMLTNSKEPLLDLTGHDYAYKGMFYGMTTLLNAPELPATTLSINCYHYTFYNCSGLTVAPALPATTLASNCYRNMFYGCTGLTSTPELPATTLVSQCYYYMFDGCSNLNEIHCNAIDISASNCTMNWVRNVSSTGTFYRNGYNDDWTDGTSGIPTSWIVVPPLPVGDWFYFEDASGAENTLSLVKTNTSAPNVTLQYSYDGRTWTSWGTTSTTAKTLTIPAHSNV